MVSASSCKRKPISIRHVLILIILEDGFCLLPDGADWHVEGSVLILIILEDGFCYWYSEFLSHGYDLS